MVAALLISLAAFATPAPIHSVVADSAGHDSLATPRVVRRFPPIEVRESLHDLRSSESVHLLSIESLGALPVDWLADAVALKAGVVARGEDLHVRGGRAGELEQLLDGVRLNEPLHGHPMEFPLLALRTAELVSGGQDAEFGGALAGVLNLRTLDPGERWSGAASWWSDARRGTHFDRLDARAGGPIPRTGLGIVASSEVTLDDTNLPALRSEGRHALPGLDLGSFGWRADNHLLGHLKLAPIAAPQSVWFEVLANRHVSQPYDPMWSVDGWVSFCPDDSCTHGIDVRPSPVPGRPYFRYRAADHQLMTDDRALTAVLSLARVSGDQRLSGVLSFSATRTLTSLGGRDDESYITVARKPIWGPSDNDSLSPFLVYAGDDPFFRRSTSQRLSARADYQRVTAHGNTEKAGFGATYDEVALRQFDGTPFQTEADSVRSYHAFAPGRYAYAQARWEFEGLVMNTGLRGEYFTAGPQARDPLTGARAHAQWSLSPRLGFAYPISARDVFSLSYIRIQQDPDRDVLYESRLVPSNRDPLGNPTLVPATVISWQTALKHLFNREWSLQLALFYRDVYGQVGTRDRHPFPFVNLPWFASADEGQASGYEVSLLRVASEAARLELHYTYMQAWGTQSREQGIDYGTILGDRPVPTGDHPLDWDRRHAFAALATWQRPGSWSLGLSSSLGSGLPWTPSRRRVFDADQSELNRRRLGWSERTDLAAHWSPALLRGTALGLEVRNLFDERNDLSANVDGYPNPVINTLYDDYGAYRTETGRGGGAYWNDADGDGKPGWVPVHDPRLLEPPRAVRLGISRAW